MFLEILFASQIAFAQDNQSVVTIDTSPVESESKKPWSADFTAELRSTRDRRDRPQNRNTQGLYELSAGAGYRFDKSLRAEAELSVEQLNGKSTFFVKQAYVEWETLAKRVHLTVGQQFLPVGILSPREHWFSSNPPFMNKLFGAAKAIDAGAVASISAFGQPWLSAEAGVFSGQLVREQDERVGDPEKAPRVASLKSRSDFHQAFVTYWEHDLAFFNPVRAWGAGAELISPEVYGLKAQVLGELWQIEQIQHDGPDERTQAYLLNGELSFWRLSGGFRFSEARGRVVTAFAAQNLPLERSKLAYMQIRLAPVLVLRAERVIEEQSVLLRDEWAGRVLLNWNL